MLYKRPPPCRPKPATICRWRCHLLADMQENAPWLTDMYTQGGVNGLVESVLSVQYQAKRSLALDNEFM